MRTSLRLLPAAALVASALSLGACGTTQEQRVASGALGGAAVGAAVSGDKVKGAVVGAVAGAVAGKVVHETKKPN